MSSPRTTVIAFLALAILIAAGSALLLLSRPEPIHITIIPPQPTVTPAPTATPLPILVYVTGEVSLPGTQHLLPHGSRVADALAAAGGLTDLANKTLVNLAGNLRDGDRITFGGTMTVFHTGFPLRPANGQKDHNGTT